MNHEQFETVKKIIDLTPGTGLAIFIFPAHFRSNLRPKIFENFFISTKEPP